MVVYAVFESSRKVQVFGSSMAMALLAARADRKMMYMKEIVLDVKGNQGTLLKLEIPETCQCGFKNFYVWGTRTNGVTRIEVRCMSCGKRNGM